MSFQEAISSGLSRYFDFNTRSSRSEYWFWVLFVFLLSIVAGAIDGVVFGIPILWHLVMLALLVPGIAVGVRSQESEPVMEVTERSQESE